MRLIVAAVGVCALVGSGCGRPLDDIEVVTASLTGTSWGGVAVIGGFSHSPGVLRLIDTDDQAHEFDVNIGGPVAGILLDVATGDEDTSDGESCLVGSQASLTLPEGETRTGGEITGGYFGSKVGMHLALGIEEHDLENGAGVKLEGSAVNFGMGFFVGFEWLDISLQE